MFFQDLFLSVVNMSVTASYVILAVLLLRLVLKGLPKKYSYALWSVVGFRLVCPVSFKSIFSLFSLKPFDMTKAQQMNEYSLTYINPEKPILRDELTTGVSAVNSVIENQVVPSAAFQSSYSVIMLALEFLWVAGIAALLIYSAVKFIKLKKSLSTSILLEKGVYQSENISSPFIVGIIHPKIYVPSGIDEGYMQYVLAHERYHIKRFDNGVKLISYFLLVLHWFNPLVWLAFYLMTKDMEMSCDEAVLSKNDGIKKAYSTALLSFAADKKFPAPSPISFSENGVKARIKNVLKFKKPKLLVQAVAIILCLALLTACAANPKQTVTEESITNAIDTVTGTFATNVYTAGVTVGANLILSYARENGRYYDKITIEKDSLKIIDNEGVEIFVSEKAEENPFKLKYYSDTAYLEEDGFLAVIGNNESLFQGDITRVTYTNSSMSKDGDVTYQVYFNKGEPFAFSDMNWVYRLEPMDFEKLLSDSIIENEKNNYKKGDYFGEAHIILGVREGDTNGRDTDKYITYYIYKEVAWLSAEKGNELGSRLVKTSGGESPAAVVFEKKGNTFELKDYKTVGDNYHSEDVIALFPKDIYNNFDYITKTDYLLLDKDIYKQVVEKYLPDVGEFIAVSFDLWDKTDKTFEDKQILLNLGDYTVKYCFAALIENTDSEELQNKYVAILSELLGEESEGVYTENGKSQSFLKSLITKNKMLLKENSPEDMKKFYPHGYMLLTMTGDIDETADTSYVGPPEGFAETIDNELADFEPLDITDEVKKITADEVKTYGISGDMKENDIVKLLGKPEKTVTESDEIFTKKVYVYGSAEIVFNKEMYGEKLTDQEEIYCARFTDKNAEFPRGIKIGDSLYTVLNKLPREYDYRTGNIYGDPYNKLSTGSAVIGYENGVLVLKISCGYWPLIKINFNENLKADLIEIVYNTDGIG